MPLNPTHWTFKMLSVSSRKTHTQDENSDQKKMLSFPQANINFKHRIKKNLPTQSRPWFKHQEARVLIGFHATFSSLCPGSCLPLCYSTIIYTQKTFCLSLNHTQASTTPRWSLTKHLRFGWQSVILKARKFNFYWASATHPSSSHSLEWALINSSVCNCCFKFRVEMSFAGLLWKSVFRDRLLSPLIAVLSLSRHSN